MNFFDDINMFDVMKLFSTLKLSIHQSKVHCQLGSLADRGPIGLCGRQVFSKTKLLETACQDS